CRFTCVRVTDQSNVCNRSQLQLKISLLALFAVGVLPRRAITRTLETHIALSSFSSATKHEFLSVAHKIDKWSCFVRRFAFALFSRPNDCTHRNFRDLIRACSSSHFLPFSMGAAFRFDDRLIKETS